MIKTFNKVTKLLDDLYYKNIISFEGSTDRLSITLDSVLSDDEIEELYDKLESILRKNISVAIINNLMDSNCVICFNKKGLIR